MKQAHTGEISQWQGLFIYRMSFWIYSTNLIYLFSYFIFRSNKNCSGFSYLNMLHVPYLFWELGLALMCLNFSTGCCFSLCVCVTSDKIIFRFFVCLCVTSSFHLITIRVGGMTKMLYPGMMSHLFHGNSIWQYHSLFVCFTYSFIYDYLFIYLWLNVN